MTFCNMPDELLDIFDEHNRPLGFAKSRSAVHRDGDWHRSVHVYVINSKEEFLAHLRSPKKDLHPNCWDTRFGGHVTAGSSVAETAVSELKQEIGLKVLFSDLIEGKIYYQRGGANNEINPVFYYCFDSPPSGLTFNDSEVVAVKWMPVASILNAMAKAPQSWTGSPDSFRQTVEDYKSLKKSRA